MKRVRGSQNIKLGVSKNYANRLRDCKWPGHGVQELSVFACLAGSSNKEEKKAMRKHGDVEQ